MFIGKITEAIHTSFVYAFLDGEGKYCEEEVNIWVRRLSFREAATKEFIAEAQAVDADTAKLAAFIPKFLNDWDIFDDEQLTVKSPITEEWLNQRPPDFVMQLSVALVPLLNGNPTKPESSVNGSGQKAKSVSRTKSS